MTTLKNLKGTAIQFLDADPVQYAGSWSSGGNLNTAKNAMTGFGSSNTAGIAAGGNIPPGAYTGQTELYNGTAWSEQNDLNVSKGYGAGIGTSTAGLYAGGTPPGALATNESWNGTSWTEVNDLNAGHSEVRGCGTSTAGILAGGRTAPYPTITNLCETWDGTNWTEVNDLNIAGVGVQLAGTSTLAIANSGANPSPTARATATELWNGSSWTNSTASNSGHREGAAAGIQTDALMGGGAFPTNAPSVITNTEIWNGTAWTEVNNMATARSQIGSTVGQQSNSQTSLAFAGETVPGGKSAATEEWTFPPATASALQEGDMWFNSSSSTLKGYGTAAGIPAATWATGGSLNVTSKNSIQGAGTQTAALSAGGSSGDPNDSTKVATAEEYNGTSWTEVNDLNSAKTVCTTTGTQTAAILFGGTPAVTETEHYNGSTWTEVGDLNTGRYEIAAAGGYTAGLAFAGRTPGAEWNAVNESWNGTSWTETTDLNTARRGAYGSGSQTACVM